MGHLLCFHLHVKYNIDFPWTTTKRNMLEIVCKCHKFIGSRMAENGALEAAFLTHCKF
jgi:hypothetical protein